VEAKLNRKLVVNIGGIVVAIAAGVALYLFYLKPYVAKWRDVRVEVSTRQKRLSELRKAFANQKNPQDELKVLRQEINSLIKANEALKKIKTPGVETGDLPKELQDPDPEIRRELYRDYMKQVMESTESGIKTILKNAQISPPDIRLYAELDHADEAAYYMNRAAGLKGIAEAMAKARSSGGTIIFDKLFLEDYNTGKGRRTGAVNIMSYSVKLTIDTQALLSFLYNLQESESHYFIENMDITPRGIARSGSAQQLTVDARINTTMVFKSQVAAQVKAVAQAMGGQRGPTAGRRRGGGLMALGMGMKAQVEKEIEEEKTRKWYEFWKWFRQ